METALNRIVPDAWSLDGTFDHNDEGADDMPAHVKSAFIGNDLTIPISGGRLALGTWQGVWLCEHRDGGGFGGAGARNLVLTVQGTK